MATLFSTIIAAALVNNLALVQLLGVSTFFSFSRQFSAAVELALLSFLVLHGVLAVGTVGRFLLRTGFGGRQRGLGSSRSRGAWPVALAGLLLWLIGAGRRFVELQRQLQLHSWFQHECCIQLQLQL